MVAARQKLDTPRDRKFNDFRCLAWRGSGTVPTRLRRLAACGVCRKSHPATHFKYYCLCDPDRAVQKVRSLQTFKRLPDKDRKLFSIPNNAILNIQF